MQNIQNISKKQKVPGRDEETKNEERFQLELPIEWRAVQDKYSL